MVEKIKNLIVSDEIDFALDLLRGLGKERDNVCLGILQGVEKDYEGGLETPEWIGNDDSRMVSLYVALGMLKGRVEEVVGAPGADADGGGIEGDGGVEVKKREGKKRAIYYLEKKKEGKLCLHIIEFLNLIIIFLK